MGSVTVRCSDLKSAPTIRASVRCSLYSLFCLIAPFCHLHFSCTMFNTTLYVNSTTPSGPRGPPPWYQFPVCAVAPYGFIFYFGVKVFNLAVGTPCNFLVIWNIVDKKSDASTSDVFIFNLAILDAYFCLMTPIEMVNRLLLDDSRIWYFQRFAYGIKDTAPLFLVSFWLR